MTDFSKQIVDWFNKNKRELPWRQSADPYIVWLSEIILQQTRVDQGIAYFNRFLQKWPTVDSLAAADEQEVLKMWQGLGYYSRARNLHATAKEVVTSYNGLFPTDFNTLIKLKGIGDYTAAAISSIAANQAHAVVDGNVYRVLSRFFGIQFPIDTGTGKRHFQSLADELLLHDDPGNYNQAIMEFGALQCVPANPSCYQCVLQPGCFAHAHSLVDKLPFKNGKTRTRNRFFNYLFIETTMPDGLHGVYLHHRKGKDIWQRLYDFPMIETTDETNFGALSESMKWRELMGNTPFHLHQSSAVFKHQLTHQTIYAVFYRIQIKTQLNDLFEKNVFLTHRKQLDQYPFPRLIDRFLIDNGLYG